ncbi:MAG: bifunctional phosphoribosylaminoimidazolecarboxamide formyltransferase/IMP cyclohydrolase [Candidatus Levybacteria bacterium]|nr:bifunctional phosphoribosylaminoimidazolecarboxamide formyltransferase/IMP cyclohydrolase [Candidatus Levybacteria bacterium]
MKYALLSVFDKTGIIELAKKLLDLGYKIISTGGTAKELIKKNIKVIPVQEITGNPESFDGRMKTISFEIESGILFDRTNKSHVKEAKDLNIKPIDIVVCNLYPFEKTIANPKVSVETAVENIDVGGPTMIRAAAKNFKNVLVVVDPKDYQRVISFCHSESRHRRTKNLERSFANAQDDIRRELAAKAFAHLSLYDSQIAKFLEKEIFPSEITIPGRKVNDLRYGENPHQKASFYLEPNTNSLFKNLKKIVGRELSFVNLTDINAGLESVRLFREPCAAIIKHNSPCGIALGKNISQALERAIDADPESAFGGTTVLNKPMDLKTAKVIGEFKNKKRANIDIIAAPQITKDALEYLVEVRKSMGIYSFGKTMNYEPRAMNIKHIAGGFILQTPDNDIEKGFRAWKVVTRKKPSPEEIKQMKIAWKFISRIRSNAVIVVDKDLPMTRGIGSGQTSRIKSTRIALEQGGKYSQDGILASDSFFPFDDSVKLAAKYGISGIVQQGGSINDILSIEAANNANVSMVFTGRRAFWH